MVSKSSFVNLFVVTQDMVRMTFRVLGDHLKADLACFIIEEVLVANDRK